MNEIKAFTSDSHVVLLVVIALMWALLILGNVVKFFSDQ